MAPDHIPWCKQFHSCEKSSFKALIWDIHRQSPHGSKPVSFSHTVLTIEWVLHRPLHFPTSTQAGESLKSTKDWYPEWCLSYLLIGKR